jgi:hypothetical protein
MIYGRLYDSDNININHILQYLSQYFYIGLRYEISDAPIIFFT